ncbi:MAG: DJ-1/PfpI family protein [Clostridia bacterium]|nr:DJ-1/PfpI family protein [Clostridia bacterium]
MYNVGIYLFNDIELLDFAGPHEVYSVTSELNSFELFNVFTVTKDGKEIKSVNGLKAVPDYSFADCPDIDIFVIPGGVGTRAEIEKPEILEWILGKYHSSAITMSVCSGARILGKLGLLNGLECTTHHEVMEHLSEIAPEARIVDKRFVDTGKIMTSGGISAGIDLSLHVVEKLFGREVMKKTVQYMEYGDWRNI